LRAGPKLIFRKFNNIGRFKVGLSLALSHFEIAKRGGYMSLLQKQTLDSFIKSVGKKTLNDYSEMTGIERTRLFRLFHGAPMKLTEFETLQSFLFEKGGEVIDWKHVVAQRQLKEPSRDQKISADLSIQIERSQRLSEFLEDLGQRRAA
jgi:hypothetical protein